jgi:glycosyltransferase involved in cell wall biosynthesis
MALQAQQLHSLLPRDGVAVELFPSNFALPAPLHRLERIPVVRTAVRLVLIWFKLWRSIRRADVVHVMAASWAYFFLAVYPTVLVGYALHKRIVVNYRGGEAREFFHRWGWMAAPVFALADVVTAPSEFLAGVIRNRFRVPVSIVPNLLDSSLFQYRQRTALRPRLLVTRHLEKIYDIECVLKAFRAVQERLSDASLWIAGGGSEQAHLQALVDEWHLHHVRFLGAVPHHELPGIYDQCDIYVNASRVDNFPGALVEASAAGLVLVSTRAGGIPFLYEDGRNAFLVEIGDWQGMADVVCRVLQHPEGALAATRAGVAVARACDWTEVRRRLFDAYGLDGSEPRITRNGTECATG